MDVFDDLVAELDRLEDILSTFDDASWETPSAAAGWTVADVVLHLAQTEEAILISTGVDPPQGSWGNADETIDDLAESLVQAQRTSGPEVFERWRVARRAGVAALRATDPERRLTWARTPLKPTTLATTRIAEHWAHGLDVTEPFRIPFPDTARLRHVAWLGHSTLPYAFQLHGEEPHDVFCELEGPDGDTWRFGSPDADSTITGSGGMFCRVGAQRVPPDQSGLVAEGPHARAALAVLRNYAG
jgi:uncharacterized protein (TIGR03084 family)